MRRILTAPGLTKSLNSLVGWLAKNEPVRFLGHVHDTANRHGIQNIVISRNCSIRAGDCSLMRTPESHEL